MPRQESVSLNPMPGPTIITTGETTEIAAVQPNPPRWWQTWTIIRRVGVFVLGAAVIIDALARGDNPWPEILIGAIMVGALPLDTLPALRHSTERSTQ